MATSNILLALLNVVTVVVFFDLPTLTVYNTLILDKEYDYIIVGAGSAGCALANRLSADASRTVLLLEAGGLEDSAVQVPFFAPLLQRTSLDWGYGSVPQQNSSFLYDGNINRYPRGKDLGGSSSINYIIYSRGDKRDYDTWASTYGATGWSYNDVLPYFVNLETSYLGYNTAERGTSGEVPVTFPTSHTVASDAFLQAGLELGYQQGDYNSGYQKYYSRVQNNIKNGERWSSSKSFLPPKIRVRPNLDVGLFCQVTKVIFQGTTAVGVQYTRYSLNLTVRARHEVILSAGAIATPQLLMLSGIGPRADLQALGIPVIADLPVGQHLQDHMTVNGVTATAKENIILNYYDPLIIPQYAFARTGVLSRAFGVECVAFVSTPATDPDYPDIQFLLSTLNPTTPEAEYIAQQIGISQQMLDGYYKQKRGQYAFQIVPILLRPKSEGFIKLRSTNPTEYPIIDPKFLSNQEDVNVLAGGARIAVETFRTEAMKKANVTLFDIPVPGCETAGALWSDEYLRCLVHQTGSSGWHPCCTAPMGTHAAAVLDARLRVRNVNHLRVADASAMPAELSGNLNIPMMMLGTKAAVIIKEDNP
ncbi:4-pyridoxate dehydrogenase-like [Amblyomma americanum]